MRILLASHYALPHIGGIEAVVDRLARELVDRGHEVVHVASDAESRGRAPPPEAPYRVIRVPAINTLERRIGVPWPLFGPQLVPDLRREIARADVVHAHGMLYGSSVLALLMAARRSVARVLTEHVGHVRYESQTLNTTEALAIASIGRLAVRRAQAVVVLNTKVEGEIRRLAGPQRVLQIPNGIDTTVYRPPRPGERERLRAELGWDDRPRVLFIGRMVAKKGIDLALAALAEAETTFELVVVGPGHPRSRLPGGVQVLGAQPPERVAELYRAADALLMASHGEGFPLSLQEAMASDMPVVVRDVPFYASYLDGAGTGARRVPGEACALAAALGELLADPAARSAAGAAAGAHARATFSSVRTADIHEDLYGELIRDRDASEGSRPPPGDSREPLSPRSPAKARCRP